MKHVANHDCKEELRESDLKVTPARLAILKLLELTETPVDVASIISYLDKHAIKTDPATVFRIMNIFTQRGIAKQIELQEGKSRYELSTDSDHHHLICEKCGSIQDISDCGIDMLEKEIIKMKGFTVNRHSLEFFGICHSCQR